MPEETERDLLKKAQMSLLRRIAAEEDVLRDNRLAGQDALALAEAWAVLKTQNRSRQAQFS